MRGWRWATRDPRYATAGSRWRTYFPTDWRGLSRRRANRPASQAKPARRRSAPPHRSGRGPAREGPLLAWATACGPCRRARRRRMPGLGPASICAGSESLSAQPRRSASQMPEQAFALPLQDPAPLVAARRPLPTALLSPALTLTMTAPFLATLPEMLMGAEPPLTRLPLVMRTG